MSDPSPPPAPPSTPPARPAWLPPPPDSGRSPAPPPGAPWYPPPPGAAEPPPAPPRRRRWLLALVGLVLVVALVGAAVVAVDRRGGGEGAASPTSTTPPKATRPAVEKAVAQISTFVERERGLRFKHPVAVRLLGEGAFQNRLLKDFDKDADEMRKDEVLMKGLGLVGPNVDLVAAMRSLLGAGVVGFYDPETKALVVRGAALSPYVRTTIAHELTHALDDQWFDLDRPAYDKASDEVAFGFSAVAEGNARRVENAYRASLSEAERQDASAEELRIGAGLDLGAVPLVLVDLIGAPYIYGEPFVEDLVQHGGDDALARAFRDPPHTSEQVLDPGAYRRHEGALSVPHPTVPGTVVKEGVAGELLISELLAPEIGHSDALEAAAGWGGDWAVAWRDGDRPCTTLTVVGDDAGETAELRDGLTRWAREHAGATVTGGAAGAPVTVASCAAATGGGPGGAA